MIYPAFVIGLAYILDILFGDPLWLPHPVRGIGYLINKLEQPFRWLIRNKRIAGLFFAIAIISAVYLTAFIIINRAAQLNYYLGIALSVFFIYTALSIKDLKVQSLRVYRALKEKDIISARRNLSFIVGRDTHGLDEDEITRATVETVSENTVDGIISPLFYAVLGAAPLALAYKAVNTLDSMVGYKNEKYKEFGWASARLDDLANFIPARIAFFLLPLASLIAGLDARGSFKVALRDAGKNPSPNSGIPEAAMAGALGVRLGGLNFYNGSAINKPLIGDEKNPLSLGHIKESIKVTYVSALLSVILFVSVMYIFHWLR